MWKSSWFWYTDLVIWQLLYCTVLILLQTIYIKIMLQIIRTGFLLLRRFGWLFISFSCLIVLASICSAILNVSDKGRHLYFIPVSKENFQSLIKYNIIRQVLLHLFTFYLVVCECICTLTHTGEWMLHLPG